MLLFFCALSYGQTTYKFIASNINTESELKQNKLSLQELIGVKEDIQFIGGYIIITTAENYNTIELKSKLILNGFMVVGEIQKDIQIEKSKE